MLIDQAAIAQHASDRAAIDNAVAAFLKSGGKITQLSAGACTDPGQDAEAKSRARGNAASRRTPKKPTHRKHGGEDLAAFARRMISEGIV